MLLSIGLAAIAPLAWGQTSFTTTTTTTTGSGTITEFTPGSTIVLRKAADHERITSAKKWAM
jgi:hypothetical protein